MLETVEWCGWLHGCYTSPSTLVWCLAECWDSACHVILENYPCWWVVHPCVWVSGDLERHLSRTLTLSRADSDGTIRFLLILNSLTWNEVTANPSANILTIIRFCKIFSDIISVHLQGCRNQQNISGLDQISGDERVKMDCYSFCSSQLLQYAVS